LCPLLLLSSELFVNARWTILSLFIVKLTTKMIASDQKSSLTLWQSGRISGSPRTAVKVRSLIQSICQAFEKLLWSGGGSINTTEWQFTFYRQR
jgi:hypothetical protein